jgi:hypothetical protein
VYHDLPTTPASCEATDMPQMDFGNGLQSFRRSKKGVLISFKITRNGVGTFSTNGPRRWHVIFLLVKFKAFQRLLSGFRPIRLGPESVGPSYHTSLYDHRSVISLLEGAD